MKQSSLKDDLKNEIRLKNESNFLDNRESVEDSLSKSLICDKIPEINLTVYKSEGKKEMSNFFKKITIKI